VKVGEGEWAEQLIVREMRETYAEMFCREIVLVDEWTFDLKDFCFLVEVAGKCEMDFKLELKIKLNFWV